MKELNLKLIEDTDVLNDAELATIEAGACSAGCKKSCQQGNSNRKGAVKSVKIPNILEVTLNNCAEVDGAD